MNNISELDPDAWAGGVEMFNCWNSPWFKMLDPDKFERHVDRVQNLDLQVVASCHSPLIGKSHIDTAFNMIRRLPHATPPPQPSQVDLDALMHAIATGQEYAWEPSPPPNGA
jgi:hypothetical protein